VAGYWRRLHDEELRNSYASPHITRIIKERMVRNAGHVARFGERRHVYKFLVVKLEGKSSLGRPSCRWEDNIKIDLIEINW